jgi:hypothetical protein
MFVEPTKIGVGSCLRPDGVSLVMVCMSIDGNPVNFLFGPDTADKLGAGLRLVAGATRAQIDQQEG